MDLYNRWSHNRDTLHLHHKYWGSDDPSLVIPEGLIWSGRIFPIIPGVNEHQDFSKELNIITATDAACETLCMMCWEWFSTITSIYTGNSRKSGETTRFSITSTVRKEMINQSLLNLVISIL